MSGPVTFSVDGRQVTARDAEASLLDVLRDEVRVGSAKDGCSPQGQCGCCTVLIDGQPRVACVTPVRRVMGRSVTTFDGLDPAVLDQWSSALVATGGSQCGFCTPGIVVRLEALRGKAGGALLARPAVDQALLAHLCRCTGWQTIVEAAATVTSRLSTATDLPAAEGRDLAAAAERATIEGGSPQRVGGEIARGRGGFAADGAPADALVAMLGHDGGWVVGETVAEVRRLASPVQGRRSTIALGWPIELPDGAWARTLRTTWVEPAYLEPDASWCAPGGQPALVLANGGAFGGKQHSIVGAVARRLADEHGRPVRVLLTREDTVRTGPKRPPLAAGVDADGRGVVRIARTAGITEAIAAVAPGLVVVEVDGPGPPTSAGVRGAGWVEAAVLLASLEATDLVRSPAGAVAEAEVTDGRVDVRVRCGAPLDEVVLRSYCIGAAHQALGWVRSEAVAVDGDGEPLDLTIRSFGVLRAVDMPTINVEVVPADSPAVNGSDAVFAAVAAAAWRHRGHPDRWPTDRR